eukprot:COSAG02_NODE_2217_length_9480_cov_4.455922_3_plen_74_part_00
MVAMAVRCDPGQACCAAAPVSASRSSSSSSSSSAGGRRLRQCVGNITGQPCLLKKLRYQKDARTRPMMAAPTV